MLAEKVKADRREFLINELFRINESKYINLPIYSYSLVELEKMYITEMCQIAKSPVLRRFYDKKNHS